MSPRIRKSRCHTSFATVAYRQRALHSVITIFDCWSRSMYLKRCTLLLVAVLATAPTLHAAPVTSPKQFFGFNLGDDYCLANYKQLSAYWAKLERESERFKVVKI